MNPFLRQPSAFKRTPIRAERPTPKTAEDGVVSLRLYDPLDSWGGEWGVSAKEFVTVLDSLPDDTKEIRLLISSPGGEVWEGLALLNALRAHPAKVVAVVEGIAASAASFIAAGVDELHMMANAEIFIHRAWGLAVGSAEVMDKMAADLAHEDRNLASIYAQKAGGDVDEWLAAMSADTWFSAEEAVAAGLADQVVKTAMADDRASKAKARFDLSVLSNRASTVTPVEAAVAPLVDTVPPVVETPPVPVDPAPQPTSSEPSETSGAEPEPNTTDPMEDDVSDLSDIARGLGLPEDAGKDAILAAIQARQPADPQPEIDDKPVTEPTPDPQPTPTQPAEPRDNPFAAELQRVSAELAEIKKAKAAADKKALFDTAVKDGKLKPADRPQWEARYDRAPDVIAEVLASIAPGTEVPVQPAGVTGGDVDDANSINAEYQDIVARLDGPYAQKAS